MTTKKELLKQIEELQKKADAMPDDDGVWIPGGSDYYYYLNSEGVVHQAVWTSNSIDRYRLEFGNVYRTKEQSLEARDKKLAKVRVLRRIAELNAKQGWTARFDGKQVNWCIGIRKTGELSCNSRINGRPLPIEYYGSFKAVKTVMAEMEDDYRLMLGVMKND